MLCRLRTSSLLQRDLDKAKEQLCKLDIEGPDRMLQDVKDEPSPTAVVRFIPGVPNSYHCCMFGALTQMGIYPPDDQSVNETPTFLHGYGH